MFECKSTKSTSTTRDVKVFTKFVLEGVEYLKEQKITKIFEVTKETNPQTGHPYKSISPKLIEQKVETVRSFTLTEVTPEELIAYRRQGIPSFVLKAEGKLFHCMIPVTSNLVSSRLLGPHICAASGNECKRLSAASDQEGGCEKVRNRSNYIERYPWITNGYETFNTRHNSFVVACCSHHEKCPPRKKFTPSELNAAKLALAQHVWSDVETLAQVKALKAKNKLQNPANTNTKLY